MKSNLFIAALFLSFHYYAQIDSKKFGYISDYVVNKTDTIHFIRFNPDTVKRKDILLFIQGSVPQALFF